MTDRSFGSDLKTKPGRPSPSLSPTPITADVTGTAIERLATASLTFADADTVRSWGGQTIELAAPVKHAWRKHTDKPLPEIRVLPVLPEILRGGPGLNRLYVAVAEANENDPGNLQTAVDELLHELTGLTRGKHGWFASATSGKTVDYAGRSVICPGPELAHDTCSIPLAMAAVLLEPVVAGVLVRRGAAATVSEAQAMLRDRAPTAIEVLSMPCWPPARAAAASKSDN